MRDVWLERRPKGCRLNEARTGPTLAEWVCVCLGWWGVDWKAGGGGGQSLAAEAGTRCSSNTLTACEGGRPHPVEGEVHTVPQCCQSLSAGVQRLLQHTVSAASCISTRHGTPSTVNFLLASFPRVTLALSFHVSGFNRGMDGRHPPSWDLGPAVETDLVHLAKQPSTLSRVASVDITSRSWTQAVLCFPRKSAQRRRSFAPMLLFALSITPHLISPIYNARLNMLLSARPAPATWVAACPGPPFEPALSLCYARSGLLLESHLRGAQPHGPLARLQFDDASRQRAGRGRAPWTRGQPQCSGLLWTATISATETPAGRYGTERNRERKRFIRLPSPSVQRWDGR